MSAGEREREFRGGLCRDGIGSLGRDLRIGAGFVSSTRLSGAANFASGCAGAGAFPCEKVSNVIINNLKTTTWESVRRAGTHFAIGVAT